MADGRRWCSLLVAGLLAGCSRGPLKPPPSDGGSEASSPSPAAEADAGTDAGWDGGGLDGGEALPGSQFFPSSGAAALTGVARLSDGSLVVQGYFEPGSVDLGGKLLVNPGDGDGLADADLFVARLGAGGEGVWTQKLGGPGAVVMPSALVVGPEDALLLSATTSLPLALETTELPAGGLLASLTAQGAWQWVLPLGESAAAVALLPDGDVVAVGGEDRGRVLWLARVRDDGEVRWRRRFRSTEGAAPTSLAVDPSGDVFVGGNYRGVLEVGRARLPPATGAPFFLRLDGEGTPRWAVGLPAADVGEDAPGATVTSLAPDGEGGLYVTGFFAQWFGGDRAPPVNGFYQGFLLAADGVDGEVRWQRWMAAQRGVMPRAVAVKGEGLYLAGTFAGAMEVDGAKLDTVAAQQGLFSLVLARSTGLVQGARAFSNGRYVWMKPLTLGDGELLLGGLGSGTLEVGGLTLEGGTEDPLLLVLPRSP